MARIVAALCVLLLVVAASARVLGKGVGQEEQRGDGITDEEVNFIKARIIEVAKMTRGTEDNADQLQKIISSALGHVWGAIVVDLDSDCNLGLAVGDPLDDKWVQLEQFGPNNWIYAIWKNRQSSNPLIHFEQKSIDHD
jgi:hypothetical protein